MGQDSCDPEKETVSVSGGRVESATLNAGSKKNSLNWVNIWIKTNEIFALKNFGVLSLSLTDKSNHYRSIYFKRYFVSIRQHKKNEIDIVIPVARPSNAFQCQRFRGQRQHDFKISAIRKLLDLDPSLSFRSFSKLDKKISC